MYNLDVKTWSLGKKHKNLGSTENEWKYWNPFRIKLSSSSDSFGQGSKSTDTNLAISQCIMRNSNKARTLGFYQAFFPSLSWK